MTALPEAPQHSPGWYLYALTAGLRASGWPAPAGIGGQPTQTVCFDEILAVASPVTVTDGPLWGADGAGATERGGGGGGEGRDVADLAALERVLVEHESVLRSLMALAAPSGASVLPARFGSLYPSLGAIRAAVAADAGQLREALSRVAARSQWDLTLTWDQRRAAALVSGPPAAQAPPSPGRSYLAMRRSERAAAEQVAVLGRSTVDALCPPPSGDAAGLARLSCLVDRARERSFSQAVLSALERGAHVALRGELSGPWPPYNFAGPSGGGVAGEPRWH
jgi:hypothetical protein